jgi:hypothetical protein
MSTMKEKTLHKLAQEFPDKTYRELEKYRDADRQEEAQQTPLSESQRRQEELEPIEKGVCVTSALKKDRQGINWKAEVKELEEGLANALAINESHQKQMGKLQVRLTEVEEDNKKLSLQIEDKVTELRKKGL